MHASLKNLVQVACLLIAMILIFPNFVESQYVVESDIGDRFTPDPFSDRENKNNIRRCDSGSEEWWFQDNLWFSYNGGNYTRMGNDMIPIEPLMGRTSSSDSSAKRQELVWMYRYFGDNFVIFQEWFGREEALFLDNNLRFVFLDEIEVYKDTDVRWAIFYDPLLAARATELVGEDEVADFSKPGLNEMFYRHLDYLEENYFSHPQYLHIDGGPVIIVWAVNIAAINIDEAFLEAKRRGIRVIGDVLGSDLPDPPLYGRTGFTLVTSDTSRLSTDVKSVIPFFRKYFSDALKKGILIPAFSPQYDDKTFIETFEYEERRWTKILARNSNDIRDLINMAVDYSCNLEGKRRIWGGTLNNWAECTTILPTKEDGPKYWDTRSGEPSCGHYYFDILEIFGERFPEYANDYIGPKLELSDDSVILTDADPKGELVIRTSKIKGRKKGKLKKLPNIEIMKGFERIGLRQLIWEPRVVRGWLRLEITFTNLDGLSETLVADFGKLKSKKRSL